MASYGFAILRKLWLPTGEKQQRMRISSLLGHAHLLLLAMHSISSLSLLRRSGGWDKIDGGQSTHAWSILTGCRDQYTIQSDGAGGYSCLGAFNPNENCFEVQANSPHDGFQGLWREQKRTSVVYVLLVVLR